MNWWREARFGMFIHWGLYAIPAGEWKGNTEHGEWIRESAQIPIGEYDQLVGRFNPVKFDASAWAALARKAGMRYMVITSKHHDGFCLFDSAHTDYDVMSSPFRRDILSELSAACAKENLRMCWYHSIMDWHHPDYLPRRHWEAADRPAAGADFNRYNAHLKHQVRELLTNYGPIGVMWFDGEWEQTWTHARGKDLYDFCRTISPSTIVNNRVDKGRNDMAGLNKPGEWAGDFGTPEQEVPASGIPGVDWETCMTMNHHWGFNRADKDFKSTKELIHTLVDVASKGGNFLLNVGPTAEGLIPPESVQRLEEIGAWMDTNGESIYGTTAGPFRSLPWGRCTQKAINENVTRLYLHVFDWPETGHLVVPGLMNRIKAATLLAPHANARVSQLEVSRSDWDVVVGVPMRPLHNADTVIAIDIEGVPDITEPPDIQTDAAEFVTATSARLSASQRDVVIRYTTDGTDPTPKSPQSQGRVRLAQPCTLKAQCFRNDLPVGPVAAHEFRRATPLPAASNATRPGLTMEWWEGEFSKIENFSTRAVDGRTEVDAPDCTLAPRKEHVALRFTGFVEVPTTDLYRFALTSDDGSRLLISGREVVSNDGLHVAISKSGSIPLEKGLHPVTVEYFNRTGDRELALEWAAAELPFAPIPSSAWAREREPR